MLIYLQKKVSLVNLYDDKFICFKNSTHSISLLKENLFVWFPFLKEHLSNLLKEHPFSYTNIYTPENVSLHEALSFLS